jgi:hypothetical protein
VTDVTRPPVDIVIPFFGSDDELAALQARIAVVRRRPEDTLTIVDNRPSASANGATGDVLGAPEVQSSYYARNRGVARGGAPWIVFLDADVDVRPDLLDRYFDPAPEPSTGILEGTVHTPPANGRVARYGTLRHHVGNENVHREGWEYAQTANVAIRREAFEQIEGFPMDIRSGGDADLCFRLVGQGWRREERPAATVEHPPRGSLRAMLRQYARYGSGAEWLNRAYPGFAPPVPLWKVLALVVLVPVRVPLARLRGGRDAALMQMIDTLVLAASEGGRFQPNRSGAGRRETLRHAFGVITARLAGGRRGGAAAR